MRYSRVSTAWSTCSSHLTNEPCKNLFSSKKRRKDDVVFVTSDRHENYTLHVAFQWVCIYSLHYTVYYANIFAFAFLYHTPTIYVLWQKNLALIQNDQLQYVVFIHPSVQYIFCVLITRVKLIVFSKLFSYQECFYNVLSIVMYVESEK